jgi:hypothetical protein
VVQEGWNLRDAFYKTHKTEPSQKICESNRMCCSVEESFWYPGSTQDIRFKIYTKKKAAET